MGSTKIRMAQPRDVHPPPRGPRPPAHECGRGRDRGHSGRTVGEAVMKPRLLRARFVAAAGPAVCALVAVVANRGDRVTTAQEPVPKSAADEYTTAIRPLVKQFCLGCHSTKVKKGGLDLERFATLDDVRSDLKPLQAIIEQVEAGEMPPAEKPQPTAGEKKRLVAWARGFLDAEARSRSGDPGHVPLRRLSNAEYNYTIRDLTGVDLRPAREFP